MLILFVLTWAEFQYSDETFETQKRLEQNADQIEMLIVGSSSSYTNLKENILGNELNLKVFNYSCPTENTTITYFKLKKFIRQLKKLKYLIISVDPGSLRVDNIYDWQFCEHGHIDLFEIPQIYSFKAHSLSNLLKGKVLSEYPLRSIKYLRSIFGLSKTFSRKNWEHRLRKYSKNREKERAQKYSEYILNKKNTQKLNLFYLNKIIELCVSNGIKIVGITHPMHAELLNNASYKKSYNEFLELLKNDKASNLKIFDYLGIYSNNNTDFLDAAHLNEIGALKYTKMFANDFKQVK